MGNIYVGVNNIARKMKGAYVGVNGVARKVKQVYIGDANGKTHIFGSTVDLMGKEVWWEWNGDGSYTLKGR